MGQRTKQPFNSFIINLMSYFPSVFPQPLHFLHCSWSFQFLYTPASLFIIIPSSCTSVCDYLWAPKFDITPKESLSHVWLFVTPWTIQSMEFSRPEYWSGYPSPSPGDLPNPGMNLALPTLQADSLPSSHQRSPQSLSIFWKWVKIFMNSFLVL